MSSGRNTSQQSRLRHLASRGQPACHICGQPIDYTLSTPDPMSYVIDHVIPIHKGGRDAIENVKAAHRSCNSTKRARIVAPIVRRSGSLT